MTDWQVIWPRSARRDLWVVVEGDGLPELGPWRTASGRKGDELVGRGELDAIGHPVWLRQSEACRAERRGDLLWTEGMPYSFVSRAFVDVLTELRIDRWRMFDIELDDRRMQPIEGYVGFVPDLEGRSEVCSRAWRFQQPSYRLIVSGRVLEALREAGAADFETEPLKTDFPAPGARDV